VSSYLEYRITHYTGVLSASISFGLADDSMPRIQTAVSAILFYLAARNVENPQVRAKAASFVIFASSQTDRRTVLDGSRQLKFSF
jgi:hypothetical protein